MLYKMKNGRLANRFWSSSPSLASRSNLLRPASRYLRTSYGTDNLPDRTEQKDDENKLGTLRINNKYMKINAKQLKNLENQWKVLKCTFQFPDISCAGISVLSLLLATPIVRATGHCDCQANGSERNVRADMLASGNPYYTHSGQRPHGRRPRSADIAAYPKWVHTAPTKTSPGSSYRFGLLGQPIARPRRPHAMPHHAFPRFTLPRLASPCHASPRHATPRLTSPSHASPCHTSPRLTSLGLATPRPASPRLASPRPAPPRLASPRPARARLGLAGLGWARLGSAGLGWAWLGSPGFGWAWLGLAGLGSAGLGRSWLGLGLGSAGRRGPAELGLAELGRAWLSSAGIVLEWLWTSDSCIT